VTIHLATDPVTHGVVEKALKAFRVCGHNIAYDMAVIMEYWPDLAPLVWSAYDEGRVFDTMICAQLTDIAYGQLTRKKGAYSLATLAKRFGQTELSKGADSWQLRYAELDNIPVKDWPAEAVKYATDDIFATRRVVISLIMGEDDRMDRTIPTMDVQVRAAFALHLASCWGLRCDEVAVATLEDRLRATVAEHVDDLITVGLMRADGTRDTSAIRDLAARKGVTKKTATGQVSTSAAALQDIDDEDLKTLSEWGKAAKILSTYLPVLQKGVKEPLHCRYGLVESGRTSCSSPNIQNLP
jgi:DNA polymerase I-like protein with 3'-5' exonuclease and polymerase domains